MSLTTKEYYEVKSFLNDFSDRWPETYNELWHKFKNDDCAFRIAVLWQYLKWAKPDEEDRFAIADFIKKLQQGDTSESLPPVQHGRTKFKVDINEIDCNGQL